MRIMLAGATGAVGRVLLPLLVHAGHDVAAMTRTPAHVPQIVTAGGRTVLADAFVRPAVLAALRAERPTVVMHQLTDLRTRDFAANSRLRVDGTRNLVDAAMAVGVERIIAQSIAWAYAPGRGPAHEEERLDEAAAPPRGAMVAAVQTHEQAVAELPIGVILRYGLFYGPGTWYAPDGLITAQLRQQELVATAGVTSFVHIADAAQAAVEALGWPAGPVNIVDDAPATGSDWMPAYARLVGAPAPPTSASAAAWERGGSNALARARGWRPTYPQWRDGFRVVLQHSA